MRDPILKITKDDIDEALASTMDNLGNDVLYRLCSEHPHHKEDQSVFAKIWLIGRAYAAAIERRKEIVKGLEGDNFFKNAVSQIKSSDIDRWFEEFKRNPSAEKAIEIHFELTGLFNKISRQNKRSLASKYLHFHNPESFFIYDTRANGAIRKITPRAKNMWQGLSINKSDKEYENFYRRCCWLQKDLVSRFGRKLSPREIDKILLYFYQKEEDKKKNQDKLASIK